MGSYYFSAQYRQTPVPAGGNMINWEWFGFFSDTPPPGDGAFIVQSCGIGDGVEQKCERLA